jgi:KDO2-lipid IV(A) lauroyltransferase
MPSASSRSSEPQTSLVRLEFLTPKYWLTWSGIGVLRILELLPYAVQRFVGSGIGMLIRHMPLAYTRIARRNIELCFPGMSPVDQTALLKRHCESLGIGLCEIATTWWGSDKRVRKLAQVEGIEHLVAALAKGRGAILVGGHFTTIEIATRILGTVVPLNVVYRPTKNALLARVMCKRFFRHGHPIAHNDIRSMIRALKHNEAVWYAPDQSYRNKGAVMADFFSIPAATSTATSRLARISGAAVLTYFPERLPGNAGYRVHIGPEFQDYPSGSDMHDVNRFNALLQAQILKVPEQYLWMHRRFKGLSADYPDYYARDTRRRGRSHASPSPAVEPESPAVEPEAT